MLQGRVNTLGRMASFGLGYPLGALTGGVLAGATGPAAAVAMVMGVVLAGSLALWLTPLRVPGHVAVRDSPAS
jgi:hypothetical protein